MFFLTVGPVPVPLNFCGFLRMVHAAIAAAQARLFAGRGVQRNKKAIILTKCATQAVPVRVARPIVRIAARQATSAPVIQISPGPPRIDAGASGRHIDGSPVTRCTPLKGDAVPSMPGQAPAYSPLFAPEPQAPHRPFQVAPPVQAFALPPDRPQKPQPFK